MKYKLSKLAIGLAAVCAFSGQANAHTFAEGALGNTATALFNFTDAKGIVNDFVTFSLVSTDGTATVNASYTPAIPAKGKTKAKAGTGVILSGMKLYEGTNLTNLSKDKLVATAVQEGSFSYQIGSMTSMIYLPTGNYFLDITGTAQSANSKYNGNLTISPVPEPTEGALLLSGIGLLGFIAARRRNIA